jgi:hypothetical protein
VTTAHHAPDGDVSVTEWATDLMAAGEETATPGTWAEATGFTDFDVVDSVHATSPAATVAVAR